MIANISLYTSNTRVSTKFTVHVNPRHQYTVLHTASIVSLSEKLLHTYSLLYLSFIYNPVGFNTLDIKYQPLQYTSKLHFNVTLQCYTSIGSSSSSYTLHTAYFNSDGNLSS